ncbi:hypothetical protein CMI37_11025 [Candidatus Pacearchaeota archaeon]|nr:hypothetical protein [Candidatus Pacearchaeota archaeon]
MPGKTREIPFMPSTLETIDYAIYEWLNEELSLHTTTNEGWKKTPVIWATAERAVQSREDNKMRDLDGTLILPRIVIDRTSVVKNLGKKGSAWGNIPRINDNKGGSITIARRIKQDKTANFANADSRKLKGGVAGNRQETFPKRDAMGRTITNKKVIYETITMPMPVYLDITYSIMIKTEYQQQMNDLLTPFMTKTDGVNYFIAKHEGHSYESFIQGEVALNNNVSSMETEYRKYETKVDINVLGYIMGEANNSEQPKVVIRENAVEVKFPRERVVFGDVLDHIDKRGFYKE